MTLNMLQTIREETKSFREEVMYRFDLNDRKVATLAESLVGLRHDMDRMRTDMQMMTIAIDVHTPRLDRIDDHLGLNTNKH